MLDYKAIVNFWSQ